MLWHRRHDRKAPTVRKYATLGSIFFSGSPRGQLLSIYKTRESNPQKGANFKAALANGDCTWDDNPFPKAVVEKAKELGIAGKFSGIARRYRKVRAWRPY
jgi:hypothetical protein